MDRESLKIFSITHPVIGYMSFELNEAPELVYPPGIEALAFKYKFKDSLLDPELESVARERMMSDAELYGRDENIFVLMT